MAFEHFIGNEQLNTSGPTQVFTMGSETWEPKLVELFLVRITGLDIIEAGMVVGIGAFDSNGNQWAFSYTDQNGASPPDCRRRAENNQCIMMLNNGGTGVDFELSFNSVGAGIFTLNLDTAPGSTYRLLYKAYGGSDITNFKAGTFAMSTTGSPTYDMTDPGFLPTMFKVSSTQQASWGNSNADAHFCHGYFDGTNNWVVAVTSLHDGDGGGDSETRRMQSNQHCLVRMNPDGGLSGEWSGNSFISTGVRFNVDDPMPGVYQCGYVAMNGVNCKVGTFTAPTGTAPQSTDVTTTFDPVTVDNCHVMDGSSDIDPGINQHMICIGAGNDAEEIAIASVSEENQDPTDSDEMNTDSQFNKLNFSRSWVAYGDVSSYGSGKFTVTYQQTQNADTLGYMALGAIAAVAGNPYYSYRQQG